MIDQQRIMPKMRDMAAVFDHHFTRKEHWNALKLHQRALSVAVFMELPDEWQKELFGDGGYRADGEEVINGLFNTAKVEKATLESCIEQDYSIQKLTYSEVMELWTKKGA